MKPTRLPRFLPALVLLLGTAALRAEEGNPLVPEPDPVPRNVRVELQVVAVPEELGIPLVAELMDEAKIEAAYEKIQGWLAKGTAQLVGWPILTMKSGNRSVFEALTEVRFQADVDPSRAVFPSTTGFPATNDFQTRNTGISLEVEPAVAEDGKTISLDLVPHHIRVMGWPKILDPGGNVVAAKPQFDVLKVTTSLTLRNGQRVLLGVFRVGEPAKHLEFFLLKAETKKVE